MMENEINDSDKLYYLSQVDWTKDDYYRLHRFLHRMFYYYEKYMDEIKKLELSRMSVETKTMIYCIVKYYNNDFLLTDNLEELKDTKPLDYKLVIDGSTASEDDIYAKMNIVY